MDLAKTQFLIETHSFGTVLRTFKRKRAHVLFDGEGKPIRPMTWPEWAAFHKQWPDEVAKDRLSLRIVWTLVEMTRA